MMLTLWLLALLLLILPMIGLLLWPVRFQLKAASNEQSDENLRLYQERCEELNQAELPDEQKAALQVELDREFLANTDQVAALNATSSSSVRWGVSGALMVLMLVMLILLYQRWGASNELAVTELLQQSAQRELSEQETQTLYQRVVRASEKQPHNIEWSYIQARMLQEQGDYAQSASIFADLLLVIPEESEADRAALLSMLAQSRFFAAEQQASDDIYQLLVESITLNPQDRQTLGMAGIMAFELGYYSATIDHLGQLWRSLPAGGESQALQGVILRAAEELEKQGEAVDLSWMQRAQLTIKVDIDDTIRQQVADDAVIFVFARALEGPPMPLAAQRLTVGELPITVVLDDRMSMVDGLYLSSVDEVMVFARLSRSGQPTASADDWQASFGPVSIRHQEDIVLHIEHSVAP